MMQIKPPLPVSPPIRRSLERFHPTVSRPALGAKRTTRWGLALAVALGWVSASNAQVPDAPQAKLPTTTLTAGMHNIVAELARSPQQQQIGMMMRTSMAQHEGMLFVFDAVEPRCFWMRNTLLPLSIAFISDDGTVVNVAEMQPRSDDSHCSAKPVRYALEMNQGWFAKRGLKAGSKLRGEPFKAASR